MKDIKSIITGLSNKEVQIFLDDSQENLRVVGNTAALTEEDKIDISTNKDRLIALLKNSKSSMESNFEVISPIATSESYEVSAGQRRLWTLSQFDGGSVVYNMPMNTTLKGSYDIECFQKAITATITRHEILRTTFKMDENGDVRQYVQPTDAINFKLSYIDFRNDVDKEASIAHYISEDSFVPFDLETGPLFRVSLLQLEDDTYVFYYNMHHIISDGWSMNVLSKDVFTFYESFVNGIVPILTPLNIQYKDYAHWQSLQLVTPKASKDKEYWLGRLSGDLPVLDLPSEGFRPSVKTHKGQHLRTYISKESADQLKRFTEEKRGSIFISLLATMNVLLHKYTSNTNIIIGSPVAGRDHIDLTDQIGFYVNTLALHNTVNPQESFASFYDRIKEDTLASFDHQMYPFDRLVEDLNIKRDVSRSAIFDVMLTVQNSGVSIVDYEIPFEDFEKIVDIGTTMAKFDLEFTFAELGDNFSFDVIYNSDIYDIEMIKGLMRHYKKLLSAVLSNPDTFIDSIEYITEEEQNTLLNVFNDTSFAHPSNKTLVDLFEEQVAKTPNAVAMICENKEFTYKDLNLISNQLAHYLFLNYDIKATDLIGVKLERDEWLLISMLAILKMGCGYVPIDINYPAKRIEYIENDSQCKLIIDKSVLASFENSEEVSQEFPKIEIASKEIAYIIYTSGSTGEPKGVMITHDNVVSMLYWAMEEFGDTDFDILYAVTSHCFDLSVYEFFYPLSIGKKIRLLDNGLSIGNHLKNDKKVLINTVPSVIQELINQNVSFENTVAINLAGESFPVFISDYFNNSDVVLRNLYGPSEDTTYSSCHVLNKTYKRSIPIGKPISNTSMYILSNELKLVPIGVIGELCISGAGISKGYLNKLELTEDKFIDNPFGKGKLYKTGDQAKWLSEGDIEYMGRLDDQVKIRGHRIELGEIEQAILSQDNVEATVALVKSVAGIDVIVSYIVSPVVLDLQKIRLDLSTILPSYLIPNYYIFLEKIPLTPNGKIDRKALPDPEITNQRVYVAPSTELEETLVTIWQDLLNVEQVGVSDNFFELGGHSLLAVRLISAIKNTINVAITITNVFSNPTISDLAFFIEGQDSSESSIESKFEVIWPIPTSESYEVSAGQRRLWTLSQFDGGSVVYNMPMNTTLKGSYDIECLQKAITATINRHEILRTTFKMDKNGDVRQYVQPTDAINFKLSYIDFRNDIDKEASIAHYISEDSFVPFDLETGPLFRVSLLQLEDDTYVFYYNMHHIISDGWSMNVLSKDVFIFYESFVNGIVPILTPLTIQYKDYAHWQSLQVKTITSTKDKAYWLENLAGELPILDLPSEKRRPSIKTHRGRSLRTYISKEKTEMLQRFTQENNSSTFISLLTTINILFHKYTSDTDIIIGSPVAGRNHADLEDQIGFYVNTLALRNTVTAQENFTSIYKRIKEQTLESFDHQMYPFDSLVESLNIKRDAGRSSVFDVILILQNTGVINEPVEILPSKTDIIVDLGETVSKFDIELNFQEVGGYLVFDITYNTGVYEYHMIEGLMGHYKQILEGVLSQPEIPIGKLTYISKVEEEELLQNFNATQTDYPTDITLVDLIESQVVNNPEGIALVYEGENMTYATLNEKANQVANYLRSIGITTESLVGLCMERSFEMVIGMLGIMKSGGAYVPIDPNYPSERIDYMIEDTKATVVLTHTNSMNVVTFPKAIKTLNLDAFDTLFADQSKANLNVDIVPSNAAYVIYTSGSTGNPKGVVNEQRGIVNRLLWAQEYYNLTTDDVLIQKTTFCFDVSVWEFFLPLITGCKLVIPRPEGHKDSDYLRELIATHKVTMIHFVPSMLSTFLLDIDVSKCASLKNVVCSGEALKISQVEDFQKVLPDVILSNLYGPTEAAIDVTSWIVPFNAVDLKRVTIGEPVANTQIYILDKEMNIQPKGVSGELYIGGIQVARGYINLPELNAYRFVNNPFGKGKLYRTGDNAKWLQDGNIEYLGREDSQVKIRGYRIELGELDTVINSCPFVNQGVVIVREDAYGVNELVAYVVLKEDKTKDNVIAYLKEHIPGYMIPGIMVQLDEMPLTSNGKVNRKALPDPTFIREYEYVAPSTELEKTLVTIWQDLLNAEQVGVTDSFFELGGHSLLAVRLISAIKNTVNVAVTITNVFSNPTISALASFIEEQDATSVLPLITKQDLPKDIPLSYAQERLWFIDKLKGSEHYHMPTLLNLKGDLNVNYLSRALKTIIERHEALRTVYIEKDGVAYQELQSSDRWELNVLSSVEDYESFISKEVNRAFDLSKDYMLRATVIRISDSEHILLLVRHHIATDGWSSSLIVNEFKELYASYKSGREADLPVLSFQYTDYAVWQRSEISGDYLSEKLDYWESKLSGVAPSALPTDYPRPSVQSSHGDRVNFKLDSDRSEALRTYAKEEGVTLFMLLLSVYKVLLYRYSGQSDICIGTTVANRPQQELESMIGFFVNTLALRSDLSGNPTFNDVLKSVKQTTLEAYDHIAVPFEKIVDRVEKTRDKSRSSLFQVLFVLNNNPDAKVAEFSDITIESMPMDYDISKFDLTIFAEDSPEGISFSFNYCSDLFSSATVSALRSHYENLLDTILTNSASSIGNLAMLNAEEEQALVVDHNTVDYSLSGEGTVLSLFEAQVSKTPDAVAFVYNDNRMTYKELDEASTRLAYYYQQTYGLEQNDLIGIMMDTSNWSFLGILSILKSGAGYVPIDPALPKERQLYMLQEANVKCLLIESSSLFDVIEFSVPVFSIDIQYTDIAALPEGVSFSSLASPDTTAYVVYTSGTTGQPKGVQVSHKNLVDYYEGLDAKIAISANKSFGLMSSLSADLGNTVLYGSLLSAGCLHLFSKETLMDGVKLQSYFKTHQIDCIKIVPSHWQALRIDTELLLPTRTLIFGGDVLPVSYVKDIAAQDPNVAIVNHYGPTESTIGKLLHQVDPDFDYVTIPVGKLFSDSEAYIVSSDMSLCPIGVSGELLLGGSGISKGYLNRDDLTQEKFIANPFTAGKSSVLYRTGDLVRRNSLGEIEFLGRVDDQVKIRGYRVELKEISRVLQGYSGIVQSEVLFREDSTGVKRLVSYLVVEDGYSESDLKSYLLGIVPDYMVPQVYVVLDQMPLTSNGKIDRKALPDPGISNQRVYVAPVTEVEKVLVTIWQDLLNIEQVGVTDDFFELGGHSLLAVRLLSAIKTTLNVAITITDIFDYTNISALASFIEGQDATSILPLVTKQELPKDIPLSYAQERLWFIDKLKGSEHYHVPTLLNLKGDLNTDYLSRALKTIVERHEALRTVYVEKEGIAYQELQSSDRWELTVLSAVSDYGSFLSKEVSRPFDLSKDYMLRATIIKVSDKEHILVMVRHHIATDGWSSSLIVNEFKELYASYKSGREADLPVLSFQYTDYAVWQRSEISGDYLSEKLDYWESKLSGVAPSALPTDYPRPSVQSSHGDRVNFKLDSDRSEALRTYAKEEGVTLFMLLLSVYKVLLYRYSGQSDICIGTTVANRPQQELESMIGFFVNTLALRSDLSGNPTFNDVLKSVKQTTLEAYDHIAVPFEKIVDRVEKTRDKSRSSLFQVLFVLNNNPDAKVAEFSDITIESMPMDYDISKFDLTIFAEDSPEGISFSFNYCSDLFSSSTVSALRSHYENLLDTILTNSASSIGNLEMLSAEEEQALVVDYNTVDYALSGEETVLSLFEAQVSKIPDAVAFVYNDNRMTYKELDEASTRLAYYYQQTYGLEQNDLIGIMMDTSNWSFLGILSILKSGAGYVPIDPALPKERQLYMLQEANVKCLLIESSSLFDVIEFSVPVFSIDIQYADIAALPEGVSFSSLASPDTTAYVVYTSGTTGQPKGVQVSHKNLVDYYEGLDAKIAISANKSFGLMSSLSADLGNTVLYGSLLSGGCLHLFSKETLMDGVKLQAYFNSHPIDCIKIVPSHWQALRIDTELLLPARTLIFGGDVLPVSYVKDITAQNPNVAIVNHYGPTESTIGKLLHKVDPDFDYVTIPVGKLFSDSEAYIVSSDMSLCPIGVSGELLLGGSGISKGYLNREDLTQEKFIANPFTAGKSSVLYRTGDLVRRNSLGEIEFLGRVDDQVKIRGYRVELKEISRVIQGYSGIVQSEVLFREDSTGVKRLVSYLVVEDGYSESDLKSYLLGIVPDYMVPQLYVVLDQMPLTSNGKIDRKALPDPGISNQRVYVAPVTEVEKVLVTIWQDLLNIEQVGITDNFFELGGDSIIVIQVVSRAKKKGYQIHVQDLFDYQTIEELTVAIQENNKELNTAEQGLLEGEVPLSPIQQWFFERGEEALSHFNQAILLSIDKKVTKENLEKTIDLIAKRHDSLRFRYTKEIVQQEEEWKQFYGESANLYRTETIEEGKDIGEAITAICVRYQESLDIEKGDLARFILIETPYSEVYNRFFMVSHHLAVDGVSWRFIIDDIETLLAEETIDEALYLENKNNSFRDWIHKLKNFAETEEIEAQLEYWQQTKFDYTPLPTDFSAKKPTRETRKTQEVILNQEHTKSLLKEVNAAYNTEINDLMLSALQMTFEEVFNTQRLALGFEGHGRENILTGIDLSGTTGWFTNKYPVILSKGDAKTDGDIIKSVKETLRRIPTKGMGYGCLRYLHSSKDIRNSLKECGWDVVFNYLGQIDNVLNQKGSFTSASEYSGAHISPTSLFEEKFIIKAIIANNELRISWDYSEERYRPETVQKLADKFVAYLTQLIEHCVSKESSEVTPSDFGLSDVIDFKEFDELFESEAQENHEDEGVLRF
jgi:amino acid adenylation domain-containing protein/non-ribosomal peptide synthase protein (TIGR01720 family)